MKTRPNQTASERAPDKANSNTESKFFGTDNPRHLRAIQALLTRPQTRAHLGAIAGCANTPELIAELRRRGLAAPCERVPDLDRDGRPIRRGVYFLADSDRRKIKAWLKARDAGRGIA